MRRIAAISLLVAICLPLAGTLTVFAYRRHQVKEAAKRQILAGLEYAELTLLRIPRSLEQRPNRTFRRFHAGEFRYQGIMYDIVRQEARGDTTWYWCITDDADTELHGKLEQQLEHLAGMDPVNQKSGKRLLLFWKGLYLVSFLSAQHTPALVAGPPPSFLNRRLCPGYFHLYHPPPERGIPGCYIMV